MNFVIPMAGRGQRFVDSGYELPKMLIEARGKTLMEWSIDSLPLELCTNLICIILQEHEVKFQLSEKINSLYGNQVKLQFLVLEGVSRGQAETVYLAKHLFDNSQELLVFNIDTYFHSGNIANALLSGSDGVLGAFESHENRFSFARVNNKGVVIRTAEKEVISDLALTGLYHFKNVADFEETVKYHLDNDIRVNNEFYIAPMYNYLIKKGRCFIIDKTDDHFILGTPDELDHFLKLPPNDSF